MINKYSMLKSMLALMAVFCLSLCVTQSASAEKKYLTYEEAMKLRLLRGQTISDNGNFVAYFTYPDRGDYEGCLVSVLKDTTYRIPCGTSPKFNKTSEWAFFTVRPKAIEAENAEKEKPKNGLAIVRTADGKITNIKSVGKYVESNDGLWLAYTAEDKATTKSDDKKKNRPGGKTIVLRNLPGEAEIELSDVSSFQFDSTSSYFVFVKSDKDAKSNGLYYVDLNAKFALPKKADGAESYHITNLTWNEKKTILAYTIGKERYDGKPDSNQLRLWNPKENKIDTLLTIEKIKAGLVIPNTNTFRWTEDGNRLFFGTKLAIDTAESFDKITYNDSNYYNIDTIRKQTQLDMWHVKDPRIKTHQKVWWDENKDHTLTAVYDLVSMSYTQLADEKLADVIFTENEDYSLGSDETPYLYKSTWDPGVFDIYNVNLHTGEKKIVARELYEEGYLSPQGKFIVYYSNKQWYAYDNKLDTTFALTDKLRGPFYNEDHDTPNQPNSYGLAGWLNNDEGVMIYDKYDIWLFNLNNINTSSMNLTDAQGRRTKNSYRIVKTDPKKRSYARNEQMYLQQFDTWNKNQGIALLDLSYIGPNKIFMENNLVKVIAKAKDADKYIFSKESYDIFPDVWISDSAFTNAKKISDANSMMADFKWGKMKLMDYVSAVGDTLQGYYIVPENFDPAKRYPVVIFFYENMSDDAHRFMIPWNSHLPAGPMYAGDDYVMFFPDVVFETGKPGQSSIDCLIPACRKLGALGVADTNAIGLWGHSWSGYQASFIITQTNFFKCVIAGAPVGNMTSAYSGIRLGSGLARQFQYEYQQSRIGGALWDSLSAYIRNSPVFFANRVNTPILIEFGNLDDAVPWSQGIELFLSLRRAQKDAIMLEYRNEPHHPRKYFNKLDYAIRMKEYYDTYLKKKPAPEWILKGIEYRGK